MALSRLLPRLQPRPETVPDEPADDVPAAVDEPAFQLRAVPASAPEPHPPPKAR